jgi:mono/diheme cytochrome c family protein
MTVVRRLLLGLAMLFAANARAAETIPPAAQQEAAEIYKVRCLMCHGADGKGDGSMAAALNPKPRNLGDPSWQKTTTNEQIDKIILEGGPAVGKSPLMPGNPDLKNKPDVVKALREIIRSFK